MHGALVTGIVFLPALGALLSCDARGMLECWRPGAAPGTVELPPAAAFKTKSETDLYALCRQKVCALAAAATADGARVALYCSDSRIRIFKSRSMRLQTVYDEAPAAQTLPEGAAADPLETGRRAALHAELIKVGPLLSDFSLLSVFSSFFFSAGRGGRHWARDGHSPPAAAVLGPERLAAALWIALWHQGTSHLCSCLFSG